MGPVREDIKNDIESVMHSTRMLMYRIKKKSPIKMKCRKCGEEMKRLGNLYVCSHCGWVERAR